MLTLQYAGLSATRPNAIAARPEPNTKTNAIIIFASIPIKFTVLISNESARIAIPYFVLYNTYKYMLIELK